MTTPDHWINMTLVIVYSCLGSRNSTRNQRYSGPPHSSYAPRERGSDYMAEALAEKGESDCRSCRLEP